MNPSELFPGRCPYCGEPIELMIDCSLDEQVYIEDCQVCCRPIVVSVVINGLGEMEVILKTDTE